MSDRRGAGQSGRTMPPGLYGSRRPPHPVSPRSPSTEARQSIIYAFPVWEINPYTGMVVLYAADRETGQLLVDDEGHPLHRVGEVPDAGMARSDARPRVVWDYIGQTVRELYVREGEHLEDKPWADVIAGKPVIIKQGFWDKERRDGEEINAIHAMAPRFNHDHNLHNPRRIPLPRLVDLRHRRDEALGRPRWVPLPLREELALQAAADDVVLAGLDGREPNYPVTVVSQAISSAWRRLPAPAQRGVRKALIASLCWAAAVVFGIGLLMELNFPKPVAAAFSVAINSTLALWVLLPERKRRRRKRK
jgi:hypothetical protein